MRNIIDKISIREKIEKREEAWENMSQAEQSAWYQKYQNRTEKSDDTDAAKD
ncbi:hypothetical protein [Ruminococcus callidus]|uniref:hypothetical protein n=1 Tax=Ruminococcus callidus TaxID=40519 RepID=UPI0015F2FB14|nr:hypothetical protein [Ruminococcus callidus]